MTKGTKTLLFGVHHFILHPLTVYIAWWKLKGCFPGWKELICTIIHDWGYWGTDNLDDKTGDCHPALGGMIAYRLFGAKYRDLVLGHSRHYAKKIGMEPSELCWADKYSICYEKWWTYLPRAILSGEIHEYRKWSDRAGFIKLSESHLTWFLWIQDKFRKAALMHDKNIIENASDL